MCNSELSYHNQMDRCSYIEDVIQALYWPQHADPFYSNMVLDAFKYINSTLTDILRKIYPNNIYGKAILHFIDRIEGKGRSLA